MRRSIESTLSNMAVVNLRQHRSRTTLRTHALAHAEAPPGTRAPPAKCQNPPRSKNPESFLLISQSKRAQCGTTDTLPRTTRAAHTDYMPQCILYLLHDLYDVLVGQHVRLAHASSARHTLQRGGGSARLGRDGRPKRAAALAPSGWGGRAFEGWLLRRRAYGLCLTLAPHTQPYLKSVMRVRWIFLQNISTVGSATPRKMTGAE
jgi:hypothetical protein